MSPVPSKLVFEVITPSDAMTLEAPDVRVAQVATLFLGEGKLGLRDAAGESVLPFFFFGGGFEGWVATEFPAGIDAFLDERAEEVAACLESITYGTRSDRAAVAAMVGPDATREELVAALARWNEAKRTSLNDFASYGRELAARLRARGRS